MRPEALSKNIQNLGRVVESSFRYAPISADLTREAGSQHLQNEKIGILRRRVRGNINFYVLGDGTGESKIAATYSPFPNESGQGITVIYTRSQEGEQKIEVLGRVPDKLAQQGLTLVKHGDLWEQVAHHSPVEPKETGLPAIRGQREDRIDWMLRTPTEEQVPIEHVGTFVELALRTARTAVKGSRRHNQEIARRSNGSPEHPIVTGELGLFQTLQRLEENANQRNAILHTPTVDFVVNGVHLRMDVKRHSVRAIGHVNGSRRDSIRLMEVERTFAQIYSIYLQANGDYDLFMQGLIPQQ